MRAQTHQMALLGTSAVEYKQEVGYQTSCASGMVEIALRRARCMLLHITAAWRKNIAMLWLNKTDLAVDNWGVNEKKKKEGQMKDLSIQLHTCLWFQGVKSCLLLSFHGHLLAASRAMVQTGATSVWIRSSSAFKKAAFLKVSRQFSPFSIV